MEKDGCCAQRGGRGLEGRWEGEGRHGSEARVEDDHHVKTQGRDTWAKLPQDPLYFRETVIFYFFLMCDFPLVPGVCVFGMGPCQGRRF